MESNVRVLVCGGRDYQDYDNVFDVLSKITHSVVIQGGARGADSLAKRWALEMEIPYEEYKADWAKYGKGAGFIRNQQMLDTGVDLVVAFPGGNGTAHMVRIATKAGVKVVHG